MTEGAASAIILRALEGTPLVDHELAEMIIATARGIGERQGITVLNVETEPDRVTITLDADRITSIGFAAELRRVTERWYTRKYDVPTLWGKTPNDIDEWKAE